MTSLPPAEPVGSRRVMEGAGIVHDNLDVILVDLTIHVQTLICLSRRIQLALWARGVEDAGTA